MAVKVELFGIPRARAGVSATSAHGANLGDVLVDLAERFPQLAEACFEGRQLRPTYLANLDGHQFVTDPETPLTDGASLLILSADAGG